MTQGLEKAEAAGSDGAGVSWPLCARAVAQTGYCRLRASGSAVCVPLLSGLRLCSVCPSADAWTHVGLIRCLTSGTFPINISCCY